MKLERDRGRQTGLVGRWGRAAMLSGGATTVLVLAVGAHRGLSPGFVAAVGVALAAQVAAFAVLDRQQATAAVADPSMTTATALTVVRGSAAVALAGFLVAGRPDGTLAWLPAVLFAAAVALDAADGALARATGSTSAFGGALDVETDSLTVLVGVLLAIRFGQAPAAFLAVGLARYAFLAALALRRRLGPAPGALPPRFGRRAIGALQMLVVALVLAPTPGAAASHVLAVAVMVPVLAGFVRDWLLVT